MYVLSPKMLKTTRSSTLSIALWWDNGTDEIYFKQSFGSSSMQTSVDTEGASYMTASIDDHIVYYIYKNGYTVLWRNMNSSFLMICPESITWEDVERMIRSIEAEPS